MSESVAHTKTIVFIHGMFMNPVSWHDWIDVFTARGYTCHAPAYPFHAGEPSWLRQNIDSALGALTFDETLASLRDYIVALPEAPILIGHSMGGLMVQKLISMDVGAAGVCIDSAPPAGVFSLEWSFLRANLPTVNPLKGNSPCLASVEWFHYAFCHTMSLAQTREAYDRFVVPESRNLPRSSTKSRQKIDFARAHRPLLMIAGELDHIIPASLNRKNVDAYRDADSRRDFKVFEGRTHYICSQSGWEDVASYVAEWIGA